MYMTTKWIEGKVLIFRIVGLFTVLIVYLAW